jgi:hypothetical protein
MATQLKKTVKPEGQGGDYTSLESCMNGNEQDLCTADKYFDVEIGGDWTSTDSYCHVHNYTTDATRRIKIYTGPSARSANGVYSTSKYAIRGPYGGSCIDLDSEYVWLEGLQVDSYTGYGIGVGANNVTVSCCIVRSANFAGYGLGIDCSYVQGCCFYNNVVYTANTGIRVRGGYFYDNHSWVFNNTVVDCDVAGITCNSSIVGYKPIAKNNLIDNCTVNFSGDWDSASDYNASTDSTQAYSSATHDRTSQTFTFSDRTGKNFCLASGDAGARNCGVSDPGSGLFSGDITGGARSGSWDIGAFEYNQYFGQQNYTWDNSIMSGEFNVYQNRTFTCPGSGNMDVKTLEAFCRSPYSTQIKLAVYTSGGTLVCESTDWLMPPDYLAPFKWVVATFSSLTWRNGYTTLTGGSSYKLAVLVKSGQTYISIGVDTVTSGDIAAFGSQTYTTMPDPIPGGLSNSNAGAMLRCSVSPGSSSGFIAKARRSISQRVGVRGG